MHIVERANLHQEAEEGPAHETIKDRFQDGHQPSVNNGILGETHEWPYTIIQLPEAEARHRVQFEFEEETFHKIRRRPHAKLNRRTERSSVRWEIKGENIKDFQYFNNLVDLRR